MRKHVIRFLLALPIVLFIATSAMNFVAKSSGEVVPYTSLLDDMLDLNAIFSPIYYMVAFGFIGLSFIGSNKETSKSLGKSLYGISAIIGLFIFLGVRKQFGLDVETTTNKLSLGGMLMMVSMVFHLLCAAALSLNGLFDTIFMSLYGRPITKDDKKNPYEQLQEWKNLLDQEIISLEEYDEVKKKIMENISFKRGSLLANITELKTVKDEGLITEEDFKSKKEEVLNN